MLLVNGLHLVSILSLKVSSYDASKREIKNDNHETVFFS